MCIQGKSMSKTLINAYQNGSNTIKHIYLNNGKLDKEVVHFKPFLGIYATKNEALVTSWTDIYGAPVKVKVFDSISNMKTWKKENSDVYDILGDVNPTIQFIATTYRKDIPFSKDGMKIFNIDIETDSDMFPKPDEVKYPINAITVNEMVTNSYTTFALQDYNPKNGNTYIKCSNEKDLLTKFINFWSESDPQIITGWNINTFDIPYLVNRITKILSVEDAKRLSSDRIIKKKEQLDTVGKTNTTYVLQGNIIWDYIELYKKYTMETRESYSLDNISKVELGDEKINYHDEYDNLFDLYHENFELFIDYNIKDTNLVYQLEQKLAYIDLALTIMHKAKCQPEQIYKTVGPWDCIMYNELINRKMLCPSSKNHNKQDFIGGYVAEPLKGLHQWLMVYDIVSSYPNQVMSGNFSNETIISDKNLHPDLQHIKREFGKIEHCIDIDKLEKIKPILQKHNVSFSSNGYFYDITNEGIIPSIFKKFFNQRKEYKKQLKDFKKQGKNQEARIADLFQYTMKILLNSGYGFLSNIHGRYFDIRIAEAITSNGQVCVRGATNTIINAYKDVSCIYNDTDSSFFSFEKIVNKRFQNKEISTEQALNFCLKFGEQYIEPELKNFFKKMSENMNFRELTIGMESECVADTTLFVAKKRYIMNKVWDEGEFLVEKPKRKIRGVEIVRSSTPMVVRNKLREVIDLIFKTRDNAILIDFITEFKKEFYEMPIDVIAFPRGVTFSDYTIHSKGLPIGVRAAFTYNNLLKMKKLDEKYKSINDSDKIKFCYINKHNVTQSNVIGFINKMPIELIECYQVDYNEQFNKTFIQPITKIFKSLGWHVEKQNSLEDWFS